MKLTLRIVTLFILVIAPAAAWSGALDDYYLSHVISPQHRVQTPAGVIRQQAVRPDRSQTLIRHQAWLDRNKLLPSTQKTLAAVMARPVLPGEKTCTPVGGHFRIHYATSGADAPDLTDANGNGVPDWVETVAGVFEYVYSVEVGKMGYRPPPVATYDVYLEALASQGVYGYTTNDSTGVTSISYPSYIEIDQSFTDSIFQPYAPIMSLRITAAHEFHHAIQYGYNAYFPSEYAEMTSTFMEDEVYDSGNQLYDYISGTKGYLDHADTIALDEPIPPPYDPDPFPNSPYGRWIFNRYLAELQGSRTVVRAVWEKLAAVGALSASPNDGVEIPIAPVINAVLGGTLSNTGGTVTSSGGNLGNNFFGFAKRMLVRDWSSHVGDITKIPQITPVATNSVQGSVAPSLNLPTLYTFAYYKYTPAVQGGQLVINFPTLPAGIAVTAFEVDATTATGWREYPYNSGSQSITITAFNNAVYLLACNNGGDMSAPVVMSPAFPTDSVSVLDGTGLDANALTIPAVTTTSSSSGGGGCFIATAAYGSYLHPKVAELRQFRDRYLLTNAPGRLFVAAYYAISPPIARVIAEHGWMRAAVRLLLTPVVFAVEHPYWALVLVVALLGAVGWRWIGWREKRKGESATVAV